MLDLGLGPGEKDSADADLEGDDQVPSLWCGSGDLCDGFYQFKNEDFGVDFGLDFAEEAGTFGCEQVYSDGEWQAVSADTVVYPAFVGLAAGWSWAMWAMHCTVSHIVSRTSPDPSRPDLLEDRRPAPCLGARGSVAGVYVDNFTVASRSQRDSKARYDAVVQEFKGEGIALHELVSPDSVDEPFEQLGLHIIGKELRIRSKPARAWRLLKALRGFQQLGSAFGWQIRVVLGHVVHHFQLLPLALSVISSSYAFVQLHLEEKVALWKSVLHEFWLLEGLVLMAEVSLAAPWSRVAFCGDASGDGYALHAAALEPDELRDVCSVRERWRFTASEKLPKFSSCSWHPGWRAGQ